MPIFAKNLTTEMEKKTHTYTESEAYSRLTALCARSELCRSDAMQRLNRWQVTDATAEKVVARLVKERYIDEERFAHAFANDKFRYNHWGSIKIALELKRRRIPQDCIDKALANIDEGENLEKLQEIIRKKRPSVRGKNDYEIRGKLIRYAAGKGFPIDEVVKVVDSLENWNDE